MTNIVSSTQSRNKVIVSTPGPQGPRGRTILNGAGSPANNLGLKDDFYYNTTTTDFYGPKLSDTTWVGATKIKLYQQPLDFATFFTWEIGGIHGPDEHSPENHVIIEHNLGFYPNVTVRTGSGDILETGIDYNSINKITLTMAQTFSGTAYLS